MFYNKQHSEHQGGFTLVEIMIALVVFSVIMLGLAAGLIAATKANRQNVLRDEALRLAKEELSRLNGERFTDSGVSITPVSIDWLSFYPSVNFHFVIGINGSLVERARYVY